MAIGQSGIHPERKTALMRDLMAARRAVKDAKSAGEQKAASGHRCCQRSLGERGADLEPQTLHMLPGMRGIHDGRVVEGGGRSPTGLRRIASDSHWQLSTH